jgi:hypothetical protein
MMVLRRAQTTLGLQKGRAAVPRDSTGTAPAWVGRVIMEIAMLKQV